MIETCYNFIINFNFKPKEDIIEINKFINSIFDDVSIVEINELEIKTTSSSVYCFIESIEEEDDDIIRFTLKLGDTIIKKIFYNGEFSIKKCGSCVIID